MNFSNNQFLRIQLNKLSDEFKKLSDNFTDLVQYIQELKEIFDGEKLLLNIIFKKLVVAQTDYDFFKTKIALLENVLQCYERNK